MFYVEEREFEAQLRNINSTPKRVIDIDVASSSSVKH